MRYGTMPVVRATGGLADTVIDADRARPTRATGFSFVDAHSAYLADAVRRAMLAMADEPRWGEIQARAWPRTTRGAARLASTWRTTARAIEIASR